MGANRVVLACNTSHLFLPDIYKMVPQAEVTVIDACIGEIVRRGIDEVYLMAFEVTILSGVYQGKLNQVRIRCSISIEKEFSTLRSCIEAVKQNQFNDEIKYTFLSFVNDKMLLILGCTVLPVLYDMYRDEIAAMNVFTPF